MKNSESQDMEERLVTDVAEKHTFHHFSHQHPLESTISPSAGNITCNGCSLRILSGNYYYDCKTCSFSLHRICSNMPRRTRHPAHPDHYLALSVSPPSANSILKCNACGDNVFGFYYNCAECRIYYHILCSSLPLSVAISSHPHTLGIEFSPPYDFCCDLCDKPSQLGWLYRCRFCEFDAHISCAISDQRIQPVPPPNSLIRQSIYSSASVMDANRMIDYGIESEELMQLVLQGVSRSNQDRNGKDVARCIELVGWDERLRSPKQNHDRDGGRIIRFRLNQTEAQISSISTSPLDRSRNNDAATDEDPAIPSYQFSDLCFSIDLLKSYSSQDHKFLANKKASADMENKEKINSDDAKMLNEELSIEGVTHYDAKLGQYQENGHGSSRIEENRIKSKNSSSRCSWWRKLFSCCYYSRYQKCSKSFKNGGL